MFGNLFYFVSSYLFIDEEQGHEILNNTPLSLTKLLVLNPYEEHSNPAIYRGRLFKKQPQIYCEKDFYNCIFRMFPYDSHKFSFWGFQDGQ